MQPLEALWLLTFLSRVSSLGWGGPVHSRGSTLGKQYSKWLQYLLALMVKINADLNHDLGPGFHFSLHPKSADFGWFHVVYNASTEIGNFLLTNVFTAFISA